MFNKLILEIDLCIYNNGVMSSETFVYYANVENLNIENYLSKLPQARQEKIAKYKFEKDIKLSIGVWIILEKAMKLHQINVSKYEVEVSEKGKPSFKDCPLQFSLSHSGTYVLVAISSSPVGADIQEMRDFNDKMINYISDEDDLKYIDSQNDKRDAFYKVWTFKEALVKKSGEGFSTQIKKIKIDYRSNQLFEYNLIPNYKIAIASELPISKPIELELIAL